VVFGGTFDPPHRWHIRAAAAARRAAFPDGWIVFVPAARSPLKRSGPTASDRDRVAMIRLAAARLPRSVIWTDEIDRAGRGPSYTVDSLERLRRALGPEVPMRLVIGADQAAQFHRWRRFRRVMDLAEPIVVLRPPFRTRRALRLALEAAGEWKESEIRQWSDRVAPLTARDVSSSEIRRALSAGRKTRTGVAVPPAVLRYIRRRGMYRSPG
jgi:nicotinate-nucleotide adenylyltransferase